MGLREFRIVLYYFGNFLLKSDIKILILLIVITVARSAISKHTEEHLNSTGASKISIHNYKKLYILQFTSHNDIYNIKIESKVGIPGLWDQGDAAFLNPYMLT